MPDTTPNDAASELNRPWQKPAHIPQEWWDSLDHIGEDLDRWYVEIGNVNDARTRLQSLAPEMAEAILAWSDAVGPYIKHEHGWGGQLHRVADRLRAIGATDA